MLHRVIVIGGGAAGFFGAIACAEAADGTEVLVLERGRFLAKVRISGGGRCNVTHHCFEPRTLVAHYPRGGRELLGPFHRFQPRDTVAWFEARGVPLKVEDDGRMFPTSDSSQTIIDCLLHAAKQAGVQLREGCGVEAVERRPEGGFMVRTTSGELLACDHLLLATGGCRSAAQGGLATALGHSLEPSVPSLFAFHTATPWLNARAGVAVEKAEVLVPGTTLRQSGPLLITHEGLSGPAILKLSAWGARELAARNYRFPVRVRWLPGLDEAAAIARLDELRAAQPAKTIRNTPLAPLPRRLWEAIVAAAGIAPEARWAQLPAAQRRRVAALLVGSEFAINGKSLNKDEFVTCGGVRLSEVDFRTMESRVCPGLFLAGELLDLDGVTGGFNFQAAWTTGWIAGQSIAHLQRGQASTS